MSNENQNKSGTSNVHTKDAKEPIVDRVWGFTKSMAKPAIAGAAGIGIAAGVKAGFNRFAQRSTENAASSAVHGGGTKLKPF